MRIVCKVKEAYEVVDPSLFGAKPAILGGKALVFDDTTWSYFVRNKIYDKILKEVSRDLKNLLVEITKQLPCATGLLQLSGRVFLERREIAYITQHGRGMSTPIIGWVSEKDRVRVAYNYVFKSSNVRGRLTNDTSSPKFWVNASRNLWDNKKIGFIIRYSRLGSDDPECLPGEENIDVAYLVLVEEGYWDLAFPIDSFNKIMDRAMATVRKELRTIFKKKIKRTNTIRTSAKLSLRVKRTKTPYKMKFKI